MTVRSGEYCEGEVIPVRLPLSREQAAGLRAGLMVSLSGPMYGARDAAHLRMVKALEAGQPLPVPLAGETIYYVGPCPAPPGWACGSAGPTTSGRMDQYTPALLEQGLLGMIGKGRRSQGVLDAMRRSGAVYFAATGGAGALYARCIERAEAVAYPDLGPEAVYRLEVRDFPVIVAYDVNGGDIYRDGPARFEINRALSEKATDG